MAKAISANERLIIVTPEPNRVRLLLEEELPTGSLRHITFCQAPTNDTWARDHSFITLLTPDGPRLLDFKFNGWGEKFPADLSAVGIQGSGLVWNTLYLQGPAWL